MKRFLRSAAEPTLFLSLAVALCIISVRIGRDAQRGLDLDAQMQAVSELRTEADRLSNVNLELRLAIVEADLAAAKQAREFAVLAGAAQVVVQALRECEQAKTGKLASVR